MRNKKGFTVAACGLFLMLGLTVIGLSGLTEPPASKVAVTKNASVEIETTPQYLLKLFDGRIAVFDPDFPETPIEITDIYASTLRNYDREQLKIGITVSGREELLMLLEDYGS